MLMPSSDSTLINTAGFGVRGVCKGSLFPFVWDFFHKVKQSLLNGIFRSHLDRSNCYSYYYGPLFNMDFLGLSLMKSSDIDDTNAS